MGSAPGPVTSELEQARAAPEFGAHTPLAEKLLAVAIRAQNFTGSSGVAIALTEGQAGHEMVCRASWGTSAPDVGARLSIEHSFTGLCVRTGEPQRCDDAQSDPRVDPEACRALGISAIAVAPVRRGVKVVGVIAAFSDTPHAFTDKHLLILTTLSEVIIELLDESQPATPPAQTAEAVSGSMPAELPISAPMAPEPSELLEQAAPAPEGGFSAAAFESEPPVATASGSAATLASAVPQPQRPLAASSTAARPAPQAIKSGAPSSVRLVPLKPPAPTPDFGPGPTFSGYDTEAGPSRRWMLPAAILVALAILAVAGWRWHVAQSAGMAKPAPPAPTQPQTVSPPQPEPAQEIKPPDSAVPETKHSPLSSPATAPSPSKAAKATAGAEMPADVTVRSSAQPVVEAQEAVRRPAASGALRAPQVPEPQVPQLALSSPELPAVLVKPSPAVVAAPVSHTVAAHLLSRVSPVYPEAARRLGISGKVVLKATITKAGAVRNVDWVSGNELFRNSAIAAVRQWHYKPATLNGQPVDSDLQIVLEFNRPTNQ